MATTKILGARRIVGAFAAALAVALASACSYFSPETGEPNVSTCRNVDSDPTKDVFFTRDLRPIMDRLKENPDGPGCKSCHYDVAGADIYATRPPGIDEGGLNMTTLAQLRAGGKTSGASVVVDFKPCESAIVKKIMGVYPTGSRMPKEGVRYLNDQEIQLFIDWIAEGAREEGGK